MLNRFYAAFFSIILLLSTGANADNPTVIMETSEGSITIELFADKAPASVKNFLSYVDDGYYNGLIFHRVIPDFMVQGGGFKPNMKRKSGQSSVHNEADNGLKNTRGTLAMARTGDPHSATSQFFINLADNSYLDFRNRSQGGWGYAVFAKVVEGMDVVDKIARTPTVNEGGYENVPREDIVIISVTRAP